jgi:hypothetical protein
VVSRDDTNICGNHRVVADIDLAETLNVATGRQPWRGLDASQNVVDTSNLAGEVRRPLSLAIDTENLLKKPTGKSNRRLSVFCILDGLPDCRKVPELAQSQT